MKDTKSEYTKSREQKRIYPMLSGIAVLAMCLLCAGCFGLYTAERIQLMKTEGTVDISNRRGREIEPVPEMKLYSGYQMATEKASYAWINLDSVKLAKMDASSQIHIDKKRKHMEVVVETGNLFFNIKEPLDEEETLDIRTSNMAVGIRGTCGWVEVIDQQHMKVYILEGTVQCTVDAPRSRESEEASVSGGQMAELAIDPEAEKGQVCTILTKAFTEEDIAGFVLEELLEDEELCEKIYADHGLEIGTGGRGEDGGIGLEDGDDPDREEPEVYDPAAEAAWQQAYLAVLASEREKNKAITDLYSEMAAQSYQLYDIDKDKIPELIVNFGTSEVAARADIYTCWDGQAVLLEKEWVTGHTIFCTWPGENAMLSAWGHMGYFGYSKVSLIDGRLTAETVYETESTSSGNEELDIQDIAPGSVYISECQIDLDIFIDRYREIMGNMEGTRAYSVQDEADGEIRQRLLQVIRENGMVYGAKTNDYGDDIGLLPFAEYCASGAIYAYHPSAVAVRQYAFADVDLDGQEECILKMEETAGESSAQDMVYVILHMQEDTVYAYPIPYYFNGEIFENGAFTYGYGQSTGNVERMIFDRDECFSYYVQPAQGVSPIRWEDFNG